MVRAGLAENGEGIFGNLGVDGRGCFSTGEWVVGGAGMMGGIGRMGIGAAHSHNLT
jgi:hypothetical protein